MATTAAVRAALVAAALAVGALGVPASASAAEPAPSPGAATKPRVTSAAAAIRNCIDVANRDVGRGDTGPYVREVQCLLNWAINPATFPLISENSDFGSRTEAKVKKFQTCANALGAGLVVDGRVGSRTAPHLEWWAAHTEYIC